ncbi:unnamed protein product, partial [Rotaria sp. Silwood2]
MIGLLSICQENIINDRIASTFSSIILKNFGDKLNDVFATINENEWTSFCQGLITLICIKLFYQGNANERSNAFDLLSKMPEGEQREYAALKLLDLLYHLPYRLPSDEGMVLFELVKPDDLKLKYLELADSLEIYIMYVTYFINKSEDNANDLKENIKSQLDRLLKENHLP